MELPPGGDQPTPELDLGLDDESLLDYSDEHDSDSEDMQLSLDVRPRATSPQKYTHVYIVVFSEIITLPKIATGRLVKI